MTTHLLDAAPDDLTSRDGVGLGRVSLGRPVGLGPFPSEKQLPCSCLLHCETPIEHATQAARLAMDYAACTVGHVPLAVGSTTIYCACILHAQEAEGARQAFVIDYSRCTARGVPVPPSATPRP